MILCKRKLEAAAKSMHQFMPITRMIFRERVDDAIVEAATVFIYEHMAEQVFGRRFADRLRKALASQYKYASDVDIDTHVYRIARHQTSFHDAQTEAEGPPRGDHEAFTLFVNSVIRALLVEAGGDPDPDLVRDTFPRFEHAARRIAEHLRGIHRQNVHVMK